MYCIVKCSPHNALHSTSYQLCKYLRYFDLSIYITCTCMSVLSFYVCILQCIGRIGRVIQLYPDGDVKVLVDGDDWTLNPYCTVPARPEEIIGLPSPCKLLFCRLVCILYIKY